MTTIETADLSSVTGGVQLNTHPRAVPQRGGLQPPTAGQGLQRPAPLRPQQATVPVRELLDALGGGQATPAATNFIQQLNALGIR